MFLGFDVGKLVEIAAGAVCIVGGILLFQFASAGGIDTVTGQTTGGSWSFGGDDVFEVLSMVSASTASVVAS
jgi:hypothetical protein